MNKEIPKPPARRYYGFDRMTIDGDGSYKELMFDTRDMAIAGRSAAHVLAGKRGWKFRTHLNRVDGGVKLQVWRVE